MSGVAPTVGAIAVGLACLLLGKGYAEYVGGRLRDYESVYGFLELMHREISCHLATPSELAAHSSDERLRECGFLDMLADGERLGVAFGSVTDKLLLSERDKAFLQSYFDGFGAGSPQSELRALDITLRELALRVRSVREDLPKRARLARVLLGLFALGIIILLL